MTWRDEYAATYLGIFGEPLLEIVRGEGCELWDSDGRRYLDLLGGIAVNALGQGHPALVDAVSAQLRILGHVSNFFTTPPQLQLARRLVDLAGGDDDSRALLVNSGTEANEAALKIALRHRPGGRMLALTHAFHGRTLGALSITWKPGYREPFTPMTGNATFVEPGDLEALERELAAGDVAALFVEVIQGEAGVRPLGHEYLVAARDLTARYGALLVVDEVQTGAGRTGQWLAHTRHGIRPDVITMAKGLAGGVPIGAVIAHGAAARALGAGDHGTTFGGNPIASAAALAVIDTVLPLLEDVAALGASWRGELAAVPGVVEVRGEGLLIGIELDRESAPVHAALLERGFITNTPTATALRLAPPLVLTAAQAASFTTALAEVL